MCVWGGDEEERREGAIESVVLSSCSSGEDVSAESVQECK